MYQKKISPKHDLLQSISNHVKRLAFLLVCCCISLQFVLAQEPDCITPTCGQMSVEIIRVYPNVSTDCSDNAADCGDRFHQMFYTVYLKYNDPSPSNPTESFLLDYKEINVKVDLLNINDVQHSYINVDATTVCFGNSTNGDLWSHYSTNNGDKVIFKASPQNVLINFQNLNSGDYCGGTSGGGAGSNRILFEYTTPTGAGSCYGSGHECAYAELFTIVVNAWPDEYIQFEFDEDNLDYIQSDDTACDPLDIENTGSNNGLSSTLVDEPDPFTSTENDFIQLQLTGPTAGTNEHYFTLTLDNTATHSFRVNLVEFYVKYSLKSYSEKPTFGGTYQPAGDPISIGPDPINSGYELYLLHYVVVPTTTWTLSASSSEALGTIHFPDPTLSNTNYSILISAEDGRLKTMYPNGAGFSSVCTSLDATGSTGYAVTNQSDPCASSTIQFNIDKVAGNDCNDPYQYKIGINNTSSAVTRPIKRVEFDLEFEMESGVSISSTVDYSNWGNPNEYYGLFSGGSVQEISGNVFRYAFATTDANALSFYLDGFTNYMVLSFNHSSNACVKSIKITKLDLQYYGNSPCIPPITNTLAPTTHKINLPICGPKLYGLVYTETNDGVEEVTLTAAPPDSPSSPCLACNPDCTPNFTEMLSKKDGTYGFCNLCSTCTHFLVTPTKDDNPLNGVTTYDLVLISKHILGIEPLASYKIIAADANNSKSITTFDIVELRKLILGIYSDLPDNSSWRFIDAGFSFTNNSNPFQDDPLPESINCIDPTDDNSVDFIGIKVGDVNNSVVANRPSNYPVTTLSFDEINSKQKDVITIPVVYTGRFPLDAIQLGLHFDPNQIALIGPSFGNIPGFGAESFGLSKSNDGEIRALWFPMTDYSEKILPGQTLFYLSFQILAHNKPSIPLITFDDNILENAAWATDGTEYALATSQDSHQRTMQSNQNNPMVNAYVHPNPTSGITSMTIITSPAFKGTNGDVYLYDAFGSQVLRRDINFVKGTQLIEMPETANLPSGVYFWKVNGVEESLQGHLIKQ